MCIARRLTGGDGEVRLPSILVVAGVRRVTRRAAWMTFVELPAVHRAAYGETFLRWRPRTATD